MAVGERKGAVMQSDMGAAGGVATLDNQKKLPEAQLPDNVVKTVNGTSGDVVIGGRNLALESGTERQVTAATTTQVRYIIYYLTDYGLDLVNNVGKGFTISFDAKVSTPIGTNASVRIRDGSHNVNKSNAIMLQDSLTTEWKHFTFDLTISETGGEIVFFAISPNEEAPILYTKNLKLELGNVATDWTPAPEDKADADLFDNAVMHRNIYRGKYLGDHVTDEQKAAISAGTFADLYTGDYWTISGVNWRIADMDYFYNVGNTNFTKHHLVIVPDTSLYSAAMNDESTTVGGYANSKMRTTNLEQAKEKITTAFANLVLTHRDYFINAVADGHGSAGSWYDSTVELMNEVMVYGAYIRAAMNTGNPLVTTYTTGNQQFAIFALNRNMVNRRITYSLRDIVSDTTFARVDDTGGASFGNATNSQGVRPYFCIGDPGTANTLETHEPLVLGSISLDRHEENEEPGENVSKLDTDRQDAVMGGAM